MNTLIIAALILLWLMAGFFIAKYSLRSMCGQQEYLDGEDLAMGLAIMFIIWPIVAFLLLCDKLAKKFNIKIK
jgi:hypothetical protein